ncbi:uncharacterized protein [Dendrobates tinctorius]|uniref:uncharacterized protein n=1 Tax=Dendrobates tinctorius TaxID=92724 RepID=UPI003CCA4542
MMLRRVTVELTRLSAAQLNGRFTIGTGVSDMNLLRSRTVVATGDAREKGSKGPTDRGPFELRRSARLASKERPNYNDGRLLYPQLKYLRREVPYSRVTRRKSEKRKAVHPHDEKDGEPSPTGHKRARRSPHPCAKKTGPSEESFFTADMEPGMEMDPVLSRRPSKTAVSVSLKLHDPGPSEESFTADMEPGMEMDPVLSGRRSKTVVPVSLKLHDPALPKSKSYRFEGIKLI